MNFKDTNMNICFDEQNKIFKLDTPHTSYVMAVAEDAWVGQVYYGPRLDSTDLHWVLGLDQRPQTPNTLPDETVSFCDCYPWEYPVANMGDFRSTCLSVRMENGQIDCFPRLVGYRIQAGKPKLEGLPATFGGAEDCATLTLELLDEKTNVAVKLLYTAFTKLDVITRSVCICNHGKNNIYLDKALSASLTLPYNDSRLLLLHGSWAREQAMEITPIAKGFHGAASHRGIPGHQSHPFLAVLDGNADQYHGRVYGMHFVYSGSFLAQIERDQFDQLRAVMGIQPEGFCWKLASGETFQTPEVVMVCSDSGLGGMTRTYHDLYRNHLIRSPYLYRPRPVLLNSWEAVYFDFDEEKLLTIARRAAELGIELFVMDDGWFGHRDAPSGSLGDWTEDRRKLPEGLNGLATKINALGMKFGLWMEPEMISPDSDLYRAHPDWAIQTSAHGAMLCRDQYVLDLSRPEVEEYVFGAVANVLRSASISYLKWDMNRPITNLGSAALPSDRQGELGHRYVMALYRIQDRLMKEFPELLLENCCSGGGRFDPAMLYYSPQIWGSDDTDAYERLKIQEGLALLYPLSTIGAHVSVCPNHTVGRMTPFETRGATALAGTFGYELDVTKLSQEDQEKIPGQIAQYHKYRELMQSGDYYRLASAREGNLDAWMVAEKDGGRVLLTMVRTRCEPNMRRKYLRLRGLDAGASYRDTESGRVYSGQVLRQIGYPLDFPSGDFQAKMVELVKEI